MEKPQSHGLFPLPGQCILLQSGPEFNQEAQDRGAFGPACTARGQKAHPGTTTDCSEWRGLSGIAIGVQSVILFVTLLELNSNSTGASTGPSARWAKWIARTRARWAGWARWSSCRSKMSDGGYNPKCVAHFSQFKISNKMEWYPNSKFNWKIDTKIQLQNQIKIHDKLSRVLELTGVKLVRRGVHVLTKN